MSESALVKEIILCVSRMPGVRVWRNNVGCGYGVGELDKLVRGQSVRPVQYGVPGAADISGIGPGGVRIEIEAKIGKKYKQTEQQRLYEAMIERHGGIYILALSSRRAVEELKRRLSERSSQDNHIGCEDLPAPDAAGVEHQP